MLERASSYEQFWGQIDYRSLQIPERFNLGVACLDDQDPGSRAITLVARDRSSQSFTFAEVLERSNRLANALLERGVCRGDVVAVVNPQSLETAVSYMALFRAGIIALPISSLFGPDALAYRFRHSGAKAVITSAANASKVREALGA